VELSATYRPQEAALSTPRCSMRCRLSDRYLVREGPLLLQFPGLPGVERCRKTAGCKPGLNLGPFRSCLERLSIDWCGV